MRGNAKVFRLAMVLMAVLVFQELLIKPSCHAQAVAGNPNLLVSKHQSQKKAIQQILTAISKVHEGKAKEAQEAIDDATDELDGISILGAPYHATLLKTVLKDLEDADRLIRKKKDKKIPQILYKLNKALDEVLGI